MTKRKTRRHKFTPIEFGYDDGRVDTVAIILPGSAFTLEGELLQKVTAAYFSLHGFVVSPGIKSLGLTKVPFGGVRGSKGDSYKIDAHHIKADSKTKGRLHMRMRLTNGNLYLWLQPTEYRTLHFSISFSKADAATFGKRLAEADGWDVE